MSQQSNDQFKGQSIMDLEQITLGQIKLKTPISIGNDTKTILRDILVLKYPLLIQTPNVYLPFGVSQQWGSDDRYFLKAAFYNNNPQQAKFRKQVEDFEKLILKKFRQKHSIVTQRFVKEVDLTPSFRQGEDLFYPPMISVKIHHQSPPMITDIYGDEQTLNNILPGSWATMIICPKHLWFRHEYLKPANNPFKLIETIRVGITWYLIEAKIRTPIPIIKRSLIQDLWTDETLCSICYQKIFKNQSFPMCPHDNNSLAHSNMNNDLSIISQSQSQPQPQCSPNTVIIPTMPSEYDKYAKMLKLGIPLLAVIQKCQMDGVDPEILRQHRSSSLAAPPPPPPLPNLSGAGGGPPPPPLPPPGLMSTSASASASAYAPTRPIISTDDLKKGLASLGKAKKIPPRQESTKIPQDDPRVPSLGMIQASLSKLRKTGQTLK